MSEIKLKQLCICNIPVIGKVHEPGIQNIPYYRSMNVIDIVQLNNLILALISP